MSVKYKTFLISYRYAGSQWSAEIKATDLADAQARLQAMAWAKVDGEIVAKIPAHSGWIAVAFVWIANKLIKPHP